MNTRVVILAAGKGKRMGADVPKPLVPIAGKPMIEHLIESVMTSGVDAQPIVVVAPDGIDLFREVLGDRVAYALQVEQKGTGHAVRVAQEAAAGADTIVILYGDHPFLSAEVIASLPALRKEHGVVLAMLTAQVPNFEGDYAIFKGWAKIIRDAEGKFVAIREAKDTSEAEKEITEVNPGLYAIDAAWLWNHLPKIENKNANGEYYLTDLIAMASTEGETIATAPVEALECVGVNTPEELKTAEKLAK